MDTLREEDRSINHHGKTMSTGGSTNAIQVRPLNTELVDRREDVELEARKRLYKQIAESNQNKAKLATCKRVGHVYIPAVVMVFAAVYWGYGLAQMA